MNSNIVILPALTNEEMDNFKPIQDLDACKSFISGLSYIDQPITYKLSSLLQIACQFSHNKAIVPYLLECGANPKYIDLEMKTARNYIALNSDSLTGFLCLYEIMQKEKEFPDINTEDRKTLVLDLIEGEIQKHQEDYKQTKKSVVDNIMTKLASMEKNNV